MCITGCICGCIISQIHDQNITYKLFNAVLFLVMAFQWRWLRQFVRRHTKPIPQTKAELWKRRLSLMYTIFTWNAIGFVAYAFYEGKGNWAKFHGLPEQQGFPAQQWSQTLGIKKATVYRIAGTNVDKFDVENKFDDKGNVVESTATSVEE